MVKTTHVSVKNFLNGVDYIVTHPDGNEEKVTRLVEFCKSIDGITPYGLRKVLQGKCESYRGYKLRYA